MEPTRKQTEMDRIMARKFRDIELLETGVEIIIDCLVGSKFDNPEDITEVYEYVRPYEKGVKK